MSEQTSERTAPPPAAPTQEWLPEEAAPKRAPRYWLPLALLLVAGGGIYAGWLWVSEPQRLPIRSVKVGGELRYMDPRDMERAVAGLAEGNFFTVDVQKIRATALLLPWVKSAGVRKVWPNVLVIEVEERRPFARWGGDGLVTLEGTSFTPKATEIPQGLPWLSGPKGTESEVIGLYRNMLAKFARLGLDLVSVTLDRRRSWTLGFRHGMVVKVGRNDPESRLDRFMRAYPLLQDPQRGVMQQVDLRYVNGFAVRWAEPPKTPKAMGRQGAGGRGNV